MKDYCQRKLTYTNDKLIALSGLAHDQYEREGQSGASLKYYKGKYAAGLWEVDMPSALLWRTHQYPVDKTQFRNAPSVEPPQRPSEYRAPSWSWASVDGHVSYDSQMLHNSVIPQGIWLKDDPPSPRKTSEYDFGAFRVQEIATVARSSDLMGAVSAGQITLIGLVAAAIVDEEHHTTSRTGLSSTYSWLRDLDEFVVGALLVDVRDEVRPSMRIYCVSVRDEQDGAEVEIPTELDEVNRGQVGGHSERNEMIMGLGLAETGGEGDGRVFRRVGLVRWVRKELFVGKEASTVKIL